MLQKKSWIVCTIVTLASLLGNAQSYGQMSSFIVITILAAGAYGDVIYVNDDAAGANDGSSWADAFSDLQSALDVAAARDEIWVAAGTYTPSARTDAVDPRSATFQLVSGTALYGGFSGTELRIDERDLTTNETMLSGDLNGDDAAVADPADLLQEPTRADNSYHVVTGSGTDETAVLDGFTITAGNAHALPGQHGGGGMLNRSGNPTVANCLFVGNAAGSFGGAMFNSSSSPAITDCVFIENTAEVGGAMFNTSTPTGPSDPLLTRCMFELNVARNGGAMSNSFSSPTLVSCTFLGNIAFGSGGALGTGGGGINALNTLHLVNCLFSGNSAGSSGGAMENSFSAATAVNCTFSANTAEVGGGMYNSASSRVRLSNCILWGNRDEGRTNASAQIHDVEPGGASITTVNYSCIQGGWTGAGGIGNINVDPFFMDADGPDNLPGTEDDDTRLVAGSPCIDAGDNEAVPADVLTDLDGNPRFFDDPNTPDTGSGLAPIVDMGAYEFVPPVVPLGPTSIEVNKTARVEGGFVAGEIIVCNVGDNPAIITGLEDCLEVHFPGRAYPQAPLPDGSTPNWFTVGCQQMPGGVLAVGACETRSYRISLCEVADYSGANSMRNVVMVRMANHPRNKDTFTTRSDSFPPPDLDCQACCLEDGCRSLPSNECGEGGGLPQGPGSDCSNTICTEACCFPFDRFCDDLQPGLCVDFGGEPQGLGSECATTACPMIEACCFPGLCDQLPPEFCIQFGGEPQGPGSDCADACEPLFSACCFEDGRCEELTFDDCVSVGGLPHPVGVLCDTNPCPQPTSACCFEDGQCKELTFDDCNSIGGLPHPVGVLCDINPCPPPAPICGDGVCDPGEEVECPVDCSCGNGICDPEDEIFCPLECCNNGACDPGDEIFCPEECSFCGNGVCDPGDEIFCPEECGFLCGNGVCDPGEEIECPHECGIFCGNGTCDPGDELFCPEECDP